MDSPAWLISILIVLVLLCGVILTLFVLRMRSLSRRVGSFESAMQFEGKDSWVGGVAIFGAQYISWFPTMSLGRKPAVAFSRSRLVIEDVRVQDTDHGTLVLSVTHNGKHYKWGMSAQSKAGLVSWMEAAPPSEEPTRI